MIRASLDVSLWVVQTAPYPALDLRNQVRPYWILSHVLTGAVEIELDGRRVPVCPGDVMVHPPNLPFSEFAAGPGVHQWMGFDASVIETTLLDILLRYPVAPVVPLGSRREEYRRTFDALQAVWQAEPERNGLRIAALTTLLISLVIGAWEKAGRPPRPESQRIPTERFAPLVAYMEDHLAERITRDDLAARCFLHPGYFDRAFRAAYGLPPMRMLQEMRLSRVRRLLATTEGTLDSIARASGLGDATRLSRAFRARFGTAPGAYRAQMRTAQTTPLYPASG